IMSKFEYQESETEEYVDLSVEVGFQNLLHNDDVPQILKIIAEEMTSQVGRQIAAPLMSISLNELTLKLRFRFFRSSVIEGIAGENINNQKLHFIFYLFAKIDSEFRLSDVSLPSFFRQFLELPSYFK